MPPKDARETIFDACANGSLERVATYVNDGGCLVEGDQRKMTMLHHACSKNQIEVVKIILNRAEEKGESIEIDSPDESGWTPLHFAASRGFTELVQLLLDNGSGANVRDEAKRTPLHIAANGGHIDTVKLLLSRGGMKNAKNVAGWSPHRYAVEAGHTEVAKLLE